MTFHLWPLSGIRRRWLVNSLSVASLIVFLSVAAFSVAISNYYYSGVSSTIATRAATASNFFSKYMKNSYNEYYDSIFRFAADFKDRNKLELQFISQSGWVEVSTAGPAMGMQPRTSDVKLALKTGKQESFIGVDPSSGERVMSVTSPILFANDQVIGAMRYVSSMSVVDQQILRSMFMALGVGVVFIAFVAFSNLYFIRSIIVPIREITKITKKIADGSYGARIEKVYDDEIGELTDTINHMSAEIMTAERVKSDFMSSVSHELRTPLTAINGWGQTLLSGDVNDPEEIRKGVRIMLKETDRLTKLVEELLDFTRMESGRLKLRMEEMDLASELEEVVYMYMDMLAREGIEMTCHVEDNLPSIMGDRARLKQVFINLIDNAVKHGGEGKRVDIALTKGVETLKITVQDHGQGISEEELPHVKLKFYKGSSKARGSGIGLAVTDEIIRLHDGQLLLNSVLGEGTEAVVVLPTRLGVL